MEKPKVFGIISIVSASLTIPAFIIDSVTATLDLEGRAEDAFIQKLEDSKIILERCEFTDNQRNRISKAIFDAERELNLNDNLDKAQEIFATFQTELIECDPRIGIELGVQDNRGSYFGIVLMPLIAISIIFGILWLRKRRINNPYGKMKEN